MSISVSFDTDGFNVAGNLRVHTGSVTFDSSYPTNGESYTAATFGLSAVKYLVVHSTDGYAFEVDHSNSKIKAFSQGITTGATAAGAQTNTTATTGALAVDDSGSEGDFRMYGTSASTSYKLGALQEVANTTDLSSVAARFIAFGS